MGFQLIAAALADIGLATAGNQTGAGALATAAAIATGNVNGPPGGTPLLHGVNALATAQVTNVPANSTVTAGGANFPFTKPGYVIRIDVSSGVSTPTNPFLLADMVWLDPTGQFRIAHESWLIPVALTASGQYRVMGKGPVKSSLLRISLTNQDGAVAMSATITLLETTHHVARDDWRGVEPVPVPGFTNVANAGFMPSNVLGAATLNFPGVGSSQFLLPLYAGQVWLSALMGANTSLSVEPASGGLNPANSLVFQTGTVGASGLVIQNQAITLPRIPCLIIAANTAAAAETVQFFLTVMEYAS